MDKVIKIIIIVILLLILSIGVYLGLYAYSVSKVEVKNIEFTEIQDFNLEGFRVNGFIELYNGGVIPVSVDKIDYKLILEQDDLELINGSLLGTIIPAGESARYNISTHVGWEPTAGLITQFFSQEEVYVKIQGNAQVKKIWFIELSLPFEYRLDIKEFMQQFIQQIIGNTAENLLGEVANYLGL